MAARGSCSFYPYHLHTHGNTRAGHGSLLSSGPPRATWGTLKPTGLTIRTGHPPDWHPKDKNPHRHAGRGCAPLLVPGSSRAHPAGALSWRSAAGRSRSAPGLATSSFTAET